MDQVNNLLWGKNILVVLLIGAAILATLGTRFMQFRLLGPILSVFTNEEKKENGISSLETFFLGTACRVGAGNIAGVVAAITVGGPGSLFWMWLVALFGASTSFIESTLAVIYREKDRDGKYIGGTPWIIRKKLKMGWLGSIYAVASILCYVGVTQVMSNSVTESVSSAYNIKQSWIAIVLTVIVGLIIFGKGKRDRIIDALNKIVPVMAGLYLGVVLYIILTNISSIPAMIGSIFSQAFGTKEIVLYIILTNISSIPAMIGSIFSQAFGTKEIAGGAMGVIIMQGVRRGLFSNEAGSGNSNYAAAVVDIDQPAKQGMVQALGVFVDTLLVCSATAFVVSNEAGSGNSNYAAAVVDIDQPAKQGMVQALGVFVDTLLVCSATAFVVLLAGAKKVAGVEGMMLNGKELSGMALFQEAIKTHIGFVGLPFTVIVVLLAGAKKVAGVEGMMLNGKELSGMALFQEAIKTHIGFVGLPFTVIVIFFFSLSTILAVAYYGKNAINYISEKTSLNIAYQIAIIYMVYIGGIKQNIFVWSLADFGLGIMTVINIICLSPLAWNKTKYLCLVISRLWSWNNDSYKYNLSFSIS